MALRIAVYGSLREGMGNHKWHLANSQTKKLSTEVVNIPFKMIDMGGFPGLLMDDTNHSVVIETYEVTPSIYRGIERLEGYPRFYNRQPIETSAGTADIYYLNQSTEGFAERYDGYPSVNIENGAFDWVEHVENRNKNRNLKSNNNDEL